MDLTAEISLSPLDPTALLACDSLLVTTNANVVNPSSIKISRNITNKYIHSSHLIVQQEPTKPAMDKKSMRKPMHMMGVCKNLVHSVSCLEASQKPVPNTGMDITIVTKFNTPMHL